MTLLIDLPSASSTPNLAQLRTQLRAKGFDFLDQDPEVDRLLNVAYQEICDLEDWPFLQATAAGAAPLTVTDLGTITSVFDTVQRRNLELVTYDDLVRAQVDITQTGSPSHYWIDNTTIVKAWPVGGTLSVRYIKDPALLVNDADEPVIPARFRDIIVTGAARVAAMDESAGQDQTALDAEYVRRLQIMRDKLLDQSRDTVYIRAGGGSDWGC